MYPLFGYGVNKKYYATSCGSIISEDAVGKLKTLKSVPAAKKGPVVCIMKDGKMNAIQVSRLVYEAYFGEKLSTGDQIRHRDGDIENNKIDNLVKIIVR